MENQKTITNIEQAGTGVPLVFLHAFPLNKSMWSGFKDRLSRNFHFISIDLSGSIDHMADSVLANLDQIGIKDKCVFTGVSMGGYVCFSLWRKAPERVRAFCFVSTRATADTQEAKEARMKTTSIVKEKGLEPLIEKMVPHLISESTYQTNPALISQLKEWIRHASPDEVCTALQGMADRPDSTSLLSSINVPCWVAYGEGDKVVKKEEMTMMADRLPKSKFQSFPNVGHLLPLEKTDLFEEAFLHFLKGRVL